MEAVIPRSPLPQGRPAAERSVPRTVWQRLRTALGAGAPGAGLDPTTGLLTKEALFSRCAQFLKAGHGPVATVLFELGDLHEVREIYGNTVRRAVILQWSRRLRAAAGIRGLVARTGPEQFLLVLPGCDVPQVQALLNRSLGTPPRLEFDPRGLELVLVPDLVVETVGDEEWRMETVHARLAVALEAQREAERRRQHYLELERARHSRPMPLRPIARRR